MGVIVIFVGPAGSGKSSLVKKYAEWLIDNEYRILVINLDPAAEYLPYKPDFDIRDYVRARDIAIKEGLGPNGALVAAMERISGMLQRIVEFIAERNAEYTLVDTPGQMEVFIFRDISWKLTRELKRVSKDVYALFIVDASVIKRASDYAFISLLSIATQLRLGIETAPVINKVDLVPNIEIYGDFIRDFGKMRKELMNEHSLYAEMLKDMSRILIMYSKSAEVPKVSAIKGYGIEDLHRLVHELSCNCGDLT